MACWQPTTPAKQHRMSALPSSAAVSSTACFTWAASVTLTVFVTICAFGKSVRRDWISVSACEGSRSNSASPERPCSSNARALMSARVPAPPVTDKSKPVQLWCSWKTWHVSRYSTLRNSTYGWRCLRRRSASLHAPQRRGNVALEVEGRSLRKKYRSRESCGEWSGQ